LTSKVDHYWRAYVVTKVNVLGKPISTDATEL